MENKKYGFFVKINDAEGIMAVSDKETFDISFTPTEVPSLGYTTDNGETVTFHYREITEKEVGEALTALRITEGEDPFYPVV